MSRGRLNDVMACVVGVSRPSGVVARWCAVRRSSRSSCHHEARHRSECPGCPSNSHWCLPISHCCLPLVSGIAREATNGRSPSPTFDHLFPTPLRRCWRFGSRLIRNSPRNRFRSLHGPVPRARRSARTWSPSERSELRRCRHGSVRSERSALRNRLSRLSHVSRCSSSVRLASSVEGTAGRPPESGS